LLVKLKSLLALQLLHSLNNISESLLFCYRKSVHSVSTDAEFCAFAGSMLLRYIIKWTSYLLNHANNMCVISCEHYYQSTLATA